ncbi:MAG: hypothetical protein ABFR89_11660 [Actinomycetota bacterium]
MRWIPALGGVIATAAGLLVLVSVTQATDATAEATAGPGFHDGVIASEMNSDRQGVVWSTEETAVIEVEVPGLPAAISRALGAEGYTELITETRLDGMLSPTLTRVLTAEGAVLVIESEEER